MWDKGQKSCYVLASRSSLDVARSVEFGKHSRRANSLQGWRSTRILRRLESCSFYFLPPSNRASRLAKSPEYSRIFGGLIRRDRRRSVQKNRDAVPLFRPTDRLAKRINELCQTERGCLDGPTKTDERTKKKEKNVLFRRRFCLALNFADQKKKIGLYFFSLSERKPPTSFFGQSFPLLFLESLITANEPLINRLISCKIDENHVRY